MTEIGTTKKKIGIHSLKNNSYAHPEIFFLSALIACNAMNWPGGVAISFCTWTSPLTNAAHPLSVHCECSMKQN